MEDIAYEILDVNNKNDLIEYEKGLYHAFKFDPDGWIIKNYKIIDKYRLISKTPYTDQVIYCIKKNPSL